jgi:hypothetical protein
MCGLLIVRLRRTHMRVLLFGLLVAVTACVSTGVIETNPGVYTIAKRSAQAGFGPPVATTAAIYREANQFCAKDGKKVETVALNEVNSGFAKPGSATLSFKCVDAAKTSAGGA